MIRLAPHEIALHADGRLDFWRTLFRYWARFIPFWIVVGFGLCLWAAFSHL